MGNTTFGDRRAHRTPPAMPADGLHRTVPDPLDPLDEMDEVDVEYMPPEHEVPAAPAHARPWARVVIGSLLVVQGFAHAGPGTWAASEMPAWFVTPVWATAMVGLVASGFGLWGATWLRRWWQHLAVAGAFASLVLLGSLSIPLFALGLVFDALIVITALEWGIVNAFPDEEDVAGDRLHRVRRWTGGTLAALILAYVATAVLLRPWHTTWGTTAEERAMRLPGDELVPGARYRMDHAITIAAPANAIWPWLVQIGQDRAGFYSYDRLERLIGDDIHNADRIHPEWQTLAAGDLVRAAQPDYLGGRLGRDLGWRVVDIVPGRALVLEGWGAFVLRPQADGTTRLHVRVRGDGRPSVAGVALGPVGLLVFEPAHFIMERGMLRGIRARAEGRI